MEPAAFLGELRRRLEPAARSALDEHPEVSESLARDVAAIEDRWSSPALDPTFVDFVAGQMMSQGDLSASLPRLRLADLFLAWWAGSGDPAGIAAFEEAFADDLAAIERRFHRLAADDARQELRIRLFVSGDGAPRIREYSGFGFLQNWLRVTAVRSFIDMARRDERHERDRDRDLGDELFAGLADSSPDPRLANLREQLSGGAKRAFSAAVAGLAPRQRNFLRHAHVEGLTLNQIAALYSIHRATVARTLGRARQQLLDDTRSHLASDLGVDESELASVIRALDTGLELSISRVLGTGRQALGTPEAK